MRKSLTPLGETEMEILHHVWNLGEATVKDVMACILERRKIAYTTVMTIMKNLADKKYLKYRRSGAAFIYSAAINPELVRFGLVQNLVDKVFKGSPSELIQTLVKGEDLSEKNRKEIMALINKLEEK